MNEAATILDFAMMSGDTKTIIVNCIDDDTGQPINLTGATLIQWQAARSVGSTVPTIARDLTSGIVVVDALNGQYAVPVHHADFESLRGTFYHESQAVLNDGSVITPIRGTIVVDPDLIKGP